MKLASDYLLPVGRHLRRNVILILAIPTRVASALGLSPQTFLASFDNNPNPYTDSLRDNLFWIESHLFQHFIYGFKASEIRNYFQTRPQMIRLLTS